MQAWFYITVVLMSVLAGISCSEQPSPPQIAVNEPVKLNNMTADNQIDPKNFDEQLLSKLLLDEINRLRVKKNLKPLSTDDILANAAGEQNRYITEKSKLSHEQTNAQMRNVQKRVAHFGGNYEMVGENLQLYGFTITTQGRNSTIAYTTYAEAAKGMLQNWVSSKPHFENLVRKEFTRTGTAIGFNKDKTGFFATQVYASYPIQN